MKSFLVFSAALFSLPIGLRADSPVEPLSAAERAASSFFERDQLWPDPGGERARLAGRGVTINLFYSAEIFGNPVGGPV